MLQAKEAKKRGQVVAMDVPPEILEEYEALGAMKGCQGQQGAISLLRKTWKADPTWGHMLVRKKIEKKQSNTMTYIEKAVIWLRMCMKLGGEPQAVKALKEGDVYSVSDMNNPGKKQALHHARVRGRARMGERAHEGG